MADIALVIPNQISDVSPLFLQSVFAKNVTKSIPIVKSASLWWPHISQKEKKNCHLGPKHQHVHQATFVHSAIYGLGVSFYWAKSQKRESQKLPNIRLWK